MELETLKEGSILRGNGSLKGTALNNVRRSHQVRVGVCPRQKGRNAGPFIVMPWLQGFLEY